MVAVIFADSYVPNVVTRKGVNLFLAAFEHLDEKRLADGANIV